MDEGIGVGDIDGDGFIDFAIGKVWGEEKARGVLWYQNPGDGSADWEFYPVATTNYHADRIRIADMNGDGKQDVVISEERYPGKVPDASLYWIEQAADRGGKWMIWKTHQIVTQYTMNNLDVADVDRDGDMDIVTCEHKGPGEQLQLWENNGHGSFTKHILDRGKEGHLGTQLADLDDDGDLDIVSTAWDDYHILHMWRNDASKLTEISRVNWEHLSSQDSRVPRPNVGRQSAALATDLDNDGTDDIVVAGWSSPSMVWLRKTESDWDRYTSMTGTAILKRVVMYMISMVMVILTYCRVEAGLPTKFGGGKIPLRNFQQKRPGNGIPLKTSGKNNIMTSCSST